MRKEENEMKICKHCRSQIPKGAKICPNCRKKQGGIVKWIVVVIIVMFVIGVAMGGGNEEPTAKSKKNETAKNEKAEFSQNETVSFKGVDFAVTNVKKTSGSDFDTAKEGYEYVIVSVKIENKSEEKISYNPFDWQMENSNGQEESTTFTTIDSDTALSSGDLNAGGVVEGTLAFEQPQGDAGLKLNYYANAIFDNEASFKIKLD
ncbi:MAG: DUF4352 domain-containing protein [Lachnospiraceae bacterium]|nr:DUF4352 domain-containing protein [Lachnospiraceae bacterium]